jgi:hypothetical protein
MPSPGPGGTRGSLATMVALIIDRFRPQPSQTQRLQTEPV